MNQNQSKYCKNQEHCNQTIRFLCLQQNCANDRLICHYCIRDRHRKHSIANLEKYIDPLARLGMNSAFPQREKYINAFQNSIISLTESSDKINELVNNQTRLIKENLIDQMAIISQTFSDDLVESASNKMSQGLATEQQVEEYVKMINLLGRKDFNDPQKLMELLNSINKQISNSLQQAYKKINNIFIQLQAKIHKYNFSNQNVDEVLNENKQKLHPYIQNIQKPKKSESAKKIQTINTIKDPSHAIIENPNKESSEEPLTKVQYQELYMNNYQIQIGLQIQDGILTMKNQVKSKVKRVIVTCCKNPQAQLLKILSLPHLQELYICWYELAKKQYLIRIINNCSNLKVFVLNCANEFDEECCRLIPKRLPRIRKLQYGWDFFGSMREYDDNIYFRLSPYTNRGCPLKTSITREMVVGLKKLQTVWLGDFMYFRPSNNEIPFKNIKQFTLGQTKGKYFRIPQKLCIQLKNMRQLLSLSILHVKIDQKKLHPILMNNPFIKTFLVQGCDDITDQSLKILAKNCNLTHLSIRQSRSIEATPVWQMQNLTTLILVECNRVKAELAIKGLQKMKYLSYLNLYGNKWVNDELVKRIPNHNNCHTLNLGRTSISDNSLQELKSMKRLKVLCIDCNKLSGMAISKLASSINFLQKLSLWGLDGELDSGYISNQDLQQLAKELTYLKHLSIRYCKQLNAEIFLKFKVLKFIQTDKQNLTLQVGSQLQKRGVKIILDLQKGTQQEV